VQKPRQSGSKNKLTSAVIGNSQIAPNVGSNPEGEAFFIRLRGPQALGDRTEQIGGSESYSSFIDVETE